MPDTSRRWSRRRVTAPCEGCGQDWTWDVDPNGRLPALLCDACLDARAQRQLAEREGKAPITRRRREGEAD